MITYLLNDKSFHRTKPEARLEVWFFGNCSVSHTTQALGSQSPAGHADDLLHDRAMWSHLAIPQPEVKAKCSYRNSSTQLVGNSIL